MRGNNPNTSWVNNWWNQLTRWKLNNSWNPTNSVVETTSENVSNSLNKDAFLNKLLEKYPFVCIENNKIYIKAELKENNWKTDWIKLVNFLTKLFSNWFYIEWFFKRISDYNKYFTANIPDNYVLGREISKVEDYSKYPEIKIEDTYEKALCEFFYDWAVLNPDIFAAHLIKNKVYFWFDKENIEKWLAYIWSHKRTPSEYVVAKKIEPINWENAKLVSLSKKIEKDLRAIWSDNFDSKEIDPYSYVNSTFDVIKWEELFKKIPATRWKIWRKINAEIIKTNSWEDKIDLKKVFIEWFEIIKKNDWCEYIIAAIDWKFSKQEDNKTAWTIMKISDTIWIVWNVDVKVWNVRFEKWRKVTISKDPNKQTDKWWLWANWSVLEWRKILWSPDLIVIEWNLLWEINVEGNTEIRIEWDIWWKWKLIHKWVWKIFVWWVISNNAIIDARNSVLELNNLDLWTVYAEVIQIKTLSRWNIIANKVEIDKILTLYNNASISIVWENIDIKEFVKSPQLNISLITKQSIFKNTREWLEMKKLKMIWEIDKILENPPFKDFSDKFKWINYKKTDISNKIEEIYDYNEAILKLVKTDTSWLLVDPKFISFLDKRLKKQGPLLSRLEQKTNLVWKINDSTSKMKNIVKNKLTWLLDQLELINKALELTWKNNSSSVKIWFNSNAKIKDISIIKFQNPWNNWDMFEDIDDKTFQELLKMSNVVSSKSEKIPVIFWTWTFYWNEKFDDKNDED